MTRRSFVLATGSAGLAPAAGPLSEHGFWDYTTPGAGGMEAFEKPDYLALLDDMAAARMNSLLICPKWSTTGYQSRLPYLDQQPRTRSSGPATSCCDGRSRKPASVISRRGSARL